jgi:hypothetical protein
MKSLCLKVLNGGRATFTLLNGTQVCLTDTWLTELQRECRAAQRRLCSLPELADVVLCKRGQPNAEAKAVNVAICKVENLCLHIYLATLKRSVCCWHLADAL